MEQFILLNADITIFIQRTGDHRFTYCDHLLPLQPGCKALQHSKCSAADYAGYCSSWTGFSHGDCGSPTLLPILEVLGTLGLIMIVLEASLDLELTGGKAHTDFQGFFHCPGDPDFMLH